MGFFPPLNSSSWKGWRNRCFCRWAVAFGNVPNRPFIPQNVQLTFPLCYSLENKTNNFEVHCRVRDAVWFSARQVQFESNTFDPFERRRGCCCIPRIDWCDKATPLSLTASYEGANFGYCCKKPSGRNVSNENEQMVGCYLLLIRLAAVQKEDPEDPQKRIR